MGSSPVKSARLLAEFVVYCMAHPELRFWQALRGWAKVPFIIASKGCPVFGSGDGAERDTYYWEGRDG